jgi:hypothetical protein
MARSVPNTDQKEKKKKKEKDGIRRKTLTMQPKNLFR